MYLLGAAVLLIFAADLDLAGAPDQLGWTSTGGVKIILTHERNRFQRCRVAVLNGGLPAWEAAGYEVETAPPSDHAANAIAEAAASPSENPQYSAKLQSDLVKGMEDVQAALAAQSVQVLDARPAARFQGSAPEPRADIPSGHMPGVVIGSGRHL